MATKDSLYNIESGYGRAQLNAIASAIPTFGRILVVNATSDQNLPRNKNMYKPKNGRIRFFTTLLEAYTEAEDSANDVIVLDAHGYHTLSAMLTVAKNRIHFYGADGGERLVTQGARIKLGVTTAITDLAPILNTGTRNTFRNLKVENANTLDQCLYGFIENGEGTLIKNFQSLKTAGLNDANHAHFWLAGDSVTIKDATFGQSNTPNTAAGFGILIDGKSGGASDVVKECMMERITVNMSVGGAVQATSAFIKIADTAAMNFANKIDRFTGLNFIPVGGTIMTDAILAPTSIVSGTLFLIDPAFGGCTGVIDNASAGVKIMSSGVAPVTAGGLAANLSD